MNAEQITNLITRAKMTWTSSAITMEKADPQLLLELWMDYFGEYEYEQVARAFKAFREGAFMPSLGQVVQQIEREGQPDDNTAWQQAYNWLNYRDQRRYVNGTGYNPRPPDGVHPEVQRIANLISIDNDQWERDFRAAWKVR